MTQILSSEIDSLIDKLRSLQAQMKCSNKNSCESLQTNSNVKITHNLLNKDTITINGKKITLENILNILDDQIIQKSNSDIKSSTKEKSTEILKNENILLFDISSNKDSFKKCFNNEISEIKLIEQSGFLEKTDKFKEITGFEETMKNFGNQRNQISGFSEPEERDKNSYPFFDEKYKSNNNLNNVTSSFIF